MEILLCEVESCQVSEELQTSAYESDLFNDTQRGEKAKASLPDSKLLSLKYRNREEVTFIYNSHKTSSLQNNDSLIFGCILSSQDSDPLM